MAKQDEEIIRAEAREFENSDLSDYMGGSVIDRIHNLQLRLRDFYSPEFKAIFLDEIESALVNNLIDHRKRSHGGKPDPNCAQEIDVEKILFYIRQELSVLPVIAHQKKVSNPAKIRNKVFVSYSHLDTKYLEDIKRHFKPFLRQIDYWDDTKIIPGQKWKDEISKAIDETKVAIVLLSTDFLGSDFIASNELPPLLKAAEEEGAVILIIIVEPCLFEEFPDLNRYQAMNPPSKPISSMTNYEKEELLVNLVRQTKRILFPD